MNVLQVGEKEEDKQGQEKNPERRKDSESATAGS